LLHKYTKHISNKTKLFANRCVNSNGINGLNLKDFNFRTLDRNGNTVLNRLIDQYNGYAIGKLLELGPDIATYKNNQGLDSINYLFKAIGLINELYTPDQIEQRYTQYEANLSNMLKYLFLY
jgi:hypothetical protein